MHRLARWVSIAGHPFVTGSVTVLANSRAVTNAVFMLIIIVPIAVLMVVQVRRGAWEHVDASNRRERPMLYLVGIGAALAACAYLNWKNPQSGNLRGVMFTLGMLTVFALITRWIKVSLHVAIAALGATVLLYFGSPAGWVLAALVPALIWSRLRLSRHTNAEVVLGLIGGITTGLLICLA